MKTIHKARLFCFSILLISMPVLAGPFQGSGGGPENSSLWPHMDLIKKTIDEYNKTGQGVSFDFVMDSNGQVFVYSKTGRMIPIGPEHASLMGIVQGGGGGIANVVVQMELDSKKDSEGNSITFTLIGESSSEPAFKEIIQQGGLKMVPDLGVLAKSITTISLKSQELIME